MSESFGKYVPVNFYIPVINWEAHCGHIFNTVMGDIREVFEEKSSLPTWPPMSSKEILILLKMLEIA